MSQEELRRVEVLARVRSKQLRVVDASRLLGVSYRQAKRLWKRYREEGPASLQHRSAGCTSNHGYAPKFRQRALDLVRKKYGGPVGERFGPTLAAEHLDAEDGLVVPRRCGSGCWKQDCGVGNGSGASTGDGASAKNILESWCRWMAAFIGGWRSADRRAA
jgi:hypothetical protein